MQSMARKNYTDDFRRQAVDLYESTPGATLRGIADDLGISRGTLSHWVKTFGTGSTTAPINNPRTPTGRLETQAEKVVRLEAENARLRAEKAKIETEKSILRQVDTIARSGMAGMQQRAVTTLAAETIRVLDPCPRRDHAARAAVDRRRVPPRNRRHRRHCGHRHRRPTAPSTGARPPPEPLDRFAAHGVTGYRDPAGRNWLLKTYAEMATRTATGQAHLTGTLDRYREQGRDLVISDSPEECPVPPVRGERAVELRRRRTPSLPDGISYMGSLDAARAAGLFHPNCTHRANAYTPGLTKPNPGTENPDGYEDRQRQRDLERRIRKSRRRVAALEELGDTSTLRRQRALVKSRRNELAEFVATHDRKPEVAARRSMVRAR
jgi:transposase